MAEPREGLAAPFTEKGFYLVEFRGVTLAVALSDPGPRTPSSVESVLKELEANETRVVLLVPERAPLEALPDTPVLDAPDPAEPGLEAAVWRALGRRPRVGVVLPAERFPAACADVALGLGIRKLVYLDAEGGLVREDGRRLSFADLEELRKLQSAWGPGRRADLRAEIERMLVGGVPAVNLCTSEGLGDELFTYAGSGTLFTRERYVVVRRLGIDDFDAAFDLVARGVEEGFLAPRPPAEVESVLCHGFGAFVEGAYLAGIGALLHHEADRCGEISSLYTLTRFLGEGVGGHLVAHALEAARARSDRYVFACTTNPRVVRFFERHGFREVEPSEVPAAKWEGYDPGRRRRVRCLRADLT